MSARAYQEVHLFPVRHHSPRTSLILRRWLDHLHPALVLIEGPEDATHLLATLVDPETVPPVAILGYQTNPLGAPAASSSALWPFASYSPEYVAALWASRASVEVELIDLGTGRALAAGAERDRASRRGPPAGSTAEAPRDEARSPSEHAAAIAGYRSFEELWEATFEAPDHDASSFREALVAYADLLRAGEGGLDPHDPRERDHHRARDAFMAGRIDAHVARRGLAPDRVAVILGAAHAAALAAGDVDDHLLPLVERSVPTATTLVPYSFPRLAEQLGYGAGNRAPQFYQRAFDAGGNYRRAALEVLVDFCDHLRLRGFMASLADTIEAYRLACTLADLRGKGQPGLDELREATVATMCRGDPSHVDTFLWPSVIGRAVGRVAARIGRTSLQAEFWREVEAKRLPSTDALEELTLKLADPVQIEASIFLHRLRLASVPYASYRGTRIAAGRRGADTDEAGGLPALSRASESWEAQWTPATDVALIERIVAGETLEQVSARVLGERLAEAKSTRVAAEVLLEAVVASITSTIPAALEACERLASDDDDLPSLAAACRALTGLVAYGTSRSTRGAGLGPEPIERLAVETFDRAVLRLPAACGGDDEAVEPVKTAMRVLHEIAVSQPIVDRGAWLEAAGALARDHTVHPATAGVAAGLLYIAGVMEEEEVTALIERRLSDALEPERAARFFGGFLEVNALVLVKNKVIVRAIDGFLAGLEPQRFRDLLPVLRRTFSGLGRTERRYLVENLISQRGLSGSAADARAVIAEKDKDALARLGADLAGAMDELDDLL